MNKGTVWALAAIMLLSAAAYGEDAKRDSKKRRPGPAPIMTIADGKILSAKYDEASGKIQITILTDSYCNAMSPKLVSTISGRATFGPFHYNLVLGPQTTRACIPNIEKEKVLTVDAPDLKVKDYAQVVIHGEDKTFATLSIGKDDQRSFAGNQGVLGNDAGHAVTFEELQQFASGESTEGSDSGSATYSNDQVSEPFVGNLGNGGAVEGGYEAAGAQ